MEICPYKKNSFEKNSISVYKNVSLVQTYQSKTMTFNLKPWLLVKLRRWNAYVKLIFNDLLIDIFFFLSYKNKGFIRWSPTVSIRWTIFIFWTRTFNWTNSFETIETNKCSRRKRWSEFSSFLEISRQRKRHSIEYSYLLIVSREMFKVNCKTEVDICNINNHRMSCLMKGEKKIRLILESNTLAFKWILRLATRTNLSTELGISTWCCDCSSRFCQRTTIIINICSFRFKFFRI